LERAFRTNGIYGGWNNAFAELTGHSLRITQIAIDSIRKYQAQDATARLQDQRYEQLGSVQHRRKKLKTKLHEPCTDGRDYTKSLANVLKGNDHFVNGY